MLSFGPKNKSSLLVAYVSKGKHNDEGVFLTERGASRTKVSNKTNDISFNKSFKKKKEKEDDKELKEFLKKSKKKSESKESDSDTDSDDSDDEKVLEENERVSELLTDDWFKMHKIRSVSTKETIRNAVRKRVPVKAELKDLFIKAIQHYNNKHSDEVCIDDGLMEIVPLKIKNMTDSIYISGASGSGKSSISASYIMNFREMFGEENPIYLFSRVASDKVLDQYNPIRIPIDANLLQNPVKPEHLAYKDADGKLQPSLVLFDDIDTIEVAKIKKEVQGIRSLLLETRRHFKIYMISTSHQLFNYASTRLLIAEATALVCFPKKSSVAQLQRYFTSILGYSMKEARAIMNTDSRWLYVHAQSPRFVVTQSCVKLI